MSPEARAKIGSALRGRKRGPHTPEHRAKIGAAHRGPRSHNWRGGVTPQNKLIRGSAQMRDWRTAVFQRDDYTCQGCGVRGGQLQADHIAPFALFPELRFDVANGRTLCVLCHRATPTWGGRARRIRREMRV